MNEELWRRHDLGSEFISAYEASCPDVNILLASDRKLDNGHNSGLSSDTELSSTKQHVNAKFGVALKNRQKGVPNITEKLFSASALQVNSSYKSPKRRFFNDSHRSKLS
jgi:hypothetical protein